MENRYKLIKRIENSSEFLALISKGMLPMVILEHKVYYEYYLDDLKKTQSKSQSVLNTSEEFDKSERTIFRAIQFMKS